jgi:bifunctional hydroxylase/dehydrase
MRQESMDTDVLIIGAGPTGLMLAGELRLGGTRVIVAERLAHPSGESRGLGFTARAMELFDQRGLLPRFRTTVEVSPRGHFGGVQFDYTVLPGAHFGARGIPQSRTEAMLQDWAAELGADIRRGHEFTGLDQDTDGVRVTLLGPDGPVTVRASYVVGCDGGRSAVRRAGGFAFPGTPPTRTMFLADVAGAGLHPRPLGERLPGGMVMSAPLGPDVYRIIVCEHGAPVRDRADEPTFPEVADAWQRITGEDIHGGTATWVSSFNDTTRQATEYRRGRVLLAGDAAHIHLPAGGQGMSTGIIDAVNLGWKLTARVQGWAPPGLLDSYHAERHPAGADLLVNTRAQGMIFLGGADAEPLRELLAGLLAHDDVQRHLAGLVSGLDVRYDAGAGQHPLLGRRLPPGLLRGAGGGPGTPQLLHPGQGLLLDRSEDPGLRDLASAWKDRVLTVPAELDPAADAEILAGAAALLVRPDGHVVWASGDGTEPDLALRRWFGEPATDAGERAMIRVVPQLHPRREPELTHRLARSLAVGPGAGPDPFDAWLAGRAAAHRFVVERIPFAALEGWSFRPGTGNLVHRTGRFFSVEGLRVTAGDGPVRRWEQPIIRQPEAGILGILTREFEGVPHFLMQAKMEPGNPNLLQLSPTVQATRSNYSRAHRGAPVRYLEHFTRPDRGRVLVDVLQSEHGSWFYRKVNRNMLVEAVGDVPVHEDFRWFTLGEIGALLRRDNVVNMDSRTVLACLPFGDRPEPALRRDAEIQSWIAVQRSSHDVSAERVPLASLRGWYRDDHVIARPDGRFLRVVAVSVQAGNREVATWSQPLIEPAGMGIAAFLFRRLGGVVHLLVSARVEAGFLDTVELGPTVQCVPANWELRPRPAFLDVVLAAGPERIVYDVVHSEEGGRFHNAESRYLFVEADDTEAPLDAPEGFQWLTPDQLRALTAHCHYVNVQARTLLAALTTGAVRLEG